MGLFSKITKSLFGEDDVDIPEFKPNPRVSRIQDLLEGFGTEGLGGRFDEFFNVIGQFGSPELDDVIRRSNVGVTRGVEENLAKRGLGRGGIGVGRLAEELLGNETKLRLADFDRAIAGRQNLLSTALNTLSNVRGGAQAQQGAENQFALNATGLDLNQRGQNLSFTGDIIGGLIGAGGIALGGASKAKVAETNAELLRDILRGSASTAT